MSFANIIEMMDRKAENRLTKDFAGISANRPASGLSCVYAYPERNLLMMGKQPGIKLWGS